MSKPVRVRFAPSPTGPLHIGGVRTALFNYLFAKKHNGTFVLRIEDTDQNRYVDGAEDYIVESLNWCNIPFDEGPNKNEKFGPYRQSERKHLYKQYADQLIESGNAYYAFDTPEELDFHRKDHEAKGKTFIYNWHNRLKLSNSLSLSYDEIKAKLDAGNDYVIRFKSPQDETLHLKDLIRGDIKIETNVLDDKVLFKSDGMPTYHLANIVDDHLMEISHVIRGEEWLPSLPLHKLLYTAFGWEAPEFAHLPLILKPHPTTYLNKNSIESFAKMYGEDFLRKFDYSPVESYSLIEKLIENPKNLSQALKVNELKDSKLKKNLKEFLKKEMFGKLSKRDGDKLGFPVFPLEWKDKKTNDISKGYREEGYFAKAVVNFLAFLGWNPGTEQEIFSLNELVEAFDLNKVNKAGARFDSSKINWFQEKYLKEYEIDNKVLLSKSLKKIIDEKKITCDNDYIFFVIDLIFDRITWPVDLWEMTDFFFEAPGSYDEKASIKAWKEDTPSIMEQVISLTNSVENFTIENIQTTIKGWITSNEIGFGKVMMPLRLALVGELKGPDVFDIMYMIGKDESIKRIEKAIGTL